MRHVQSQLFFVSQLSSFPAVLNFSLKKKKKVQGKKEKMIQLKSFHSEEWKYKIAARAVGTLIKTSKLSSWWKISRSLLGCEDPRVCTQKCQYDHGFLWLCGTSCTWSSWSTDFIFASAAHLLWNLRNVNQIIPFNKYFWMLKFSLTNIYVWVPI